MYKDIPFLKKTEEKVKQVCAPLFEELNLNYFSYMRGTLDLKLITLTSNHKLVEYVRDTDALKTVEGAPPLMTRKILFYDDVDTNSAFYNQFVLPLINNFDVSHIITLIRVSGFYYEFFTFGSSHANVQFRNDFVEKLTLIESFLPYFKMEMNEEIKQAKKYALPFKLTRRIKNNISEIKSIKEDNIIDAIEKFNQANQNMDKFKTKKYFLEVDDKEIIMTARETEVLLLLVHGLTMKQIAKRLSIAWTTARTHIDSLRIKFQCNSKKELIQLIHESDLEAELSYSFQDNYQSANKVCKIIHSVLDNLSANELQHEDENT